MRGKISWYGNFTGNHTWVDHEDNNITASGIPNTQPGIAVFNQHTLRGWWRLVVRDAQGHTRSLVRQQIEIGPSPGTGRKFDFNAALMDELGYSPHNAPTDMTIEAHYLGKKKPAWAKEGAPTGGKAKAPAAAAGAVGSGVLAGLIAQQQQGRSLPMGGELQDPAFSARRRLRQA